MKQKAVAMATAFTMLLAVGATGLSSEVLHQHPAYAKQNVQVEDKIIPVLGQSDKLMLAAPDEVSK